MLERERDSARDLAIDGSVVLKADVPDERCIIEPFCRSRVPRVPRSGGGHPILAGSGVVLVGPIRLGERGSP
jgi:hypothetical protein